MPENADVTPSQPRDLKCTLAFEEFGMVQWAAKRTPHILPDGQARSMPLAEFYRRALLQAARAVVAEQIRRGKSIPADIAATVDRTREDTL